MNVAVTTLLLSIVNVTGLVVPVTSPPQPANDDVTLGTAVSVTTVPWVNVGPVGLVVTTPVPLPA